MKNIFVSHSFAGNEKMKQTGCRYERPGMQFINQLEVFRPMEGLCAAYVLLAACMNLIRRCDAVLQCDGWEKRAGCQSEAAFGIANEIPCMDHENLPNEK